MSTSPESQPQPRSWQDELTATGDELVARVEKLVQEGNVRRVIIKHDDRSLLEIPLALGVVGALLAPQLAALAALVTHCTVTVEREEPGPTDAGEAEAQALPPNDKARVNARIGVRTGPGTVLIVPRRSQP